MASVATALIPPQPETIKAHLLALFAPLQESYPKGLVELRYGQGGKLDRSAYFGMHDTGLSEAAEFAANRNHESCNVYVGVNPRKPGTDRSKAASATDVECAIWHFADIDKAPAVEQLGRRIRSLPPTMSVTTGTVPNRRPHLYWQLEEPSGNMADWTQRQRNIAAAVEGDAVIDPPRIMRLAGTVNYPTQDKIKKGYKPELVTLKTEFDEERPPVIPQELDVAFPSQGTNPVTPDGQTTLQAMASQGVRPADYIARIQAGDNWHNNARDLVAHWVSMGWSDAEILLAAGSLTLSGYTVEDTERSLQQYLRSARTKFNVPEPDQQVVAEPEGREFAPTAWQPIDPAKIPPREWLFGDILARKFVSVLVAPPGVGKSILTIEAAISVALKRPLGPFDAHEQTNVWLFNNEDPRDELNRRISAFLIEHEIAPSDLAGRLFVDTGEEQHLMVATYDKHGAVVRLPVVDSMIQHIKANNIGLLIVDPFLETHGVNENSNNDIGTVARLYREIAQKTGCAVWLVHHTRKTPAGAVASAPGDSDAGRGASALGGVARFTATLFNMTKKEAEEMGIEDRHLYVRFDDGKANLKLKTGEGIWWRKKSVSLGNARGFRPADSMGVLEHVDMAAMLSDGDEHRREQWQVIGHALCTQMEAGEDITLNAAVGLVEQAAREAGLTSDRSVRRFLETMLETPRAVGAWRIFIVNERRGNGSKWVRKEGNPQWN